MAKNAAKGTNTIALAPTDYSDLFHALKVGGKVVARQASSKNRIRGACSTDAFKGERSKSNTAAHKRRVSASLQKRRHSSKRAKGHSSGSKRQKPPQINKSILKNAPSAKEHGLQSPYGNANQQPPPETDELQQNTKEKPSIGGFCVWLFTCCGLCLSQPATSDGQGDAQSHQSK